MQRLHRALDAVAARFFWVVVLIGRRRRVRYGPSLPWAKPLQGPYQPTRHPAGLSNHRQKGRPRVKHVSKSPFTVRRQRGKSSSAGPAVPGLAGQRQQTGRRGCCRVEVAKNTGVGSDLAYASRSVVEVGGVLAFRHQSKTTNFRLSPSVGYFFIDNLELTLFPELVITRIAADGDEAGEGAQTDWSVGVVLEPSYHMPFNDRLFAFAALGVGLNFAEDPGVDLLFRPRLGLDVLVGRSGILKPAAFMDVGVNDGLSAGGFEAGFTVMW